ncbi:MAG: threonine--tRNA ligase [Chlamydiales bacterium]|nr:threonine--tRNA ligase [Chlamydiales bacterium]
MLINVIDNKTSKTIQVEINNDSTAKDLAQKLNLTGPNQGLGISINGTTLDLSHSLHEGDLVTFWTFDDPIGKEMFWHTTAHVLAQAILRLFPNAKPTIGPPIEHGFYYDFADLWISDTDFERIEAEMEKIINENYVTKREVFASKEEALASFKNNKYKTELIEKFGNGELTGYRQGEFFDLCRGPHIPNLGKIKAFKVLKTSGAYWHGDSKNEMLTRIYGISFPDRKSLKEFLHQQEEAKKRDHKVLGPKLDLFSLKEEAPGMPFIHPKGMIIWNKLLEYWRECHKKAHYVEIKTPVMMTRELWEKSGHWYNYRQNMYTSSIEEREFAIKPMNCPGCMLYYKSVPHSYREFPLRIAEIGHVHRHEASGALSGLFRVRGFHQDDAHIFLTREQIGNEIQNILHLVDEIYTTFGLSYHLELSTRPEKNTIGSDEDWDAATSGLKQALESMKRPYRLNEGDGAFYGPKIDIHIKDAIGRTWQCGTIQLDFALPQKFDLEYVSNDGTRPRPVMLHRVIYGSIERFFGILIEHFAGRFPLWLNPRQVRILTVADRHVPFANEIAKKLHSAGILCEVDDTSESISKKVREAQVAQTSYMLTIGDKEVEHQNCSLRTRDNLVIGELNIDEFISTIEKEMHTKALLSPYTKEGSL